MEFFDKGLTEYLIFREERYLQKSKKLGETFKRFKVPPFIRESTTEKKDTSRVSAKKATKKISEAQKKIDIARSRGYSTREILQYDHAEYPCFDEGNLTKHKEHELLVPLEQLLDTPEYQFDKTVTAGISVIVDFISLIRKIEFEKYPKVRDAFDGAWGVILATSNADRIEIVYDSYLEVSIIESTRIRRKKEEPIEIINLNLNSPVPPEIKKFWASSINKERLQILSRNYFLMKGKEKGKNIILSSYLTDKDGVCNAQELINDEITERDDLNCIEEEADSRIVLHIACAAKKDFKQLLVL